MLWIIWLNFLLYRYSADNSSLNLWFHINLSGQFSLKRFNRTYMPSWFNKFRSRKFTIKMGTGAIGPTRLMWMKSKPLPNMTDFFSFFQKGSRCRAWPLETIYIGLDFLQNLIFGFRTILRKSKQNWSFLYDNINRNRSWSKHDQNVLKLYICI